MTLITYIHKIKENGSKRPGREPGGCSNARAVLLLLVLSSQVAASCPYRPGYVFLHVSLYVVILDMAVFLVAPPTKYLS